MTCKIACVVSNLASVSCEKCWSGPLQPMPTLIKTVHGIPAPVVSVTWPILDKNPVGPIVACIEVRCTGALR